MPSIPRWRCEVYILLVADGRSPITRSWMRMLARTGCRVSLVSTYPCGSLPDGVKQFTLPVGFAGLAGGQVGGSHSAAAGASRRLISRFRPLLFGLRALAAPLTLRPAQRRFLEIVEEIKPDLVHALRIPFEGMLASAMPQGIPFIVSIWGNDLTLHARSSPGMGVLTRRTLQRADGLLADAARDLRLAREWNFREGLPQLVLPGNGGLDLDALQRIIADPSDLPFDLPPDRSLVVNPRGFRPGSVHQEVFFQSIPQVIEAMPAVLFACPGMQGQPQAQGWVEKLGLQEHVRLLPYLPQETLWRLFARAQVYMSLSSHDGTPNTFLEALACGCFPLVGDIESLREWLADGVNGLLVDPRSPQAAASALLRALQDEPLRRSARARNLELVARRAEAGVVAGQWQAFLGDLLG